MASTEHPSPSEQPQWRSGFRRFLLGFGLLGFAMGFLAGASDSPVIGVLLPLLFGLVGGATGFYLGNLDPSSPQAEARLRVLGMALIVFIIPMLLASVWGVMERQGWGIADLISIKMGKQHATIPSIEQNGLTTNLRLALMRKRLEMLGVSEEEQAAILQQLSEDRGEAVIDRNFTPTLERLAELATRARALFSEGREQDSFPRSGNEMIILLGDLARNFMAWAQQLREGQPLSPDAITEEIAKFRMELGRHKLHGDISRYLVSYDKLQQQLWELEWALLVEGQYLKAFTLLQRHQIAEEIDRLLIGSALKDEQPVVKPKTSRFSYTVP